MRFLGPFLSRFGSLFGTPAGATAATSRRRAVLLPGPPRRRTWLHTQPPTRIPTKRRPINAEPLVANERSSNQKRFISRDMQTAGVPRHNRSKATSAPFIYKKHEKPGAAAAHNFPARKDYGGAEGLRLLHLFRGGKLCAAAVSFGGSCHLLIGRDLVGRPLNRVSPLFVSTVEHRGGRGAKDRPRRDGGTLFGTACWPLGDLFGDRFCAIWGALLRPIGFYCCAISDFPTKCCKQG